MDRKRKADLTKLARAMNKMTAVPLPIIPEVLACFDAIITPQENEFLLKLGDKRHSRNDLQAISGLDDAAFEPFLKRILKYALILHKFDDNNQDYYELHSIFVGWFEMVLMSDELNGEQLEFAIRLKAMFDKLKRLNILPIRALLNIKASRSPGARSVVTIGAEPEPQHRSLNIDKGVLSEATLNGVFPAGSVDYYLSKFEKPDSIALCNCFCRTLYKAVGEPCRDGLPVKACIIFGSLAKQMVEVDYGTFISKDEAKEIIEDCKDKGAILNIVYEQQDLNQPEMAICNCCKDCCGVWGSYNRGLLAVNVRAYYIAREFDDKCVGCKRCVSYCPTNAITITNGKSHRLLSKCVGCGQCAYQCQHGAVQMQPEDRRVFIPISKKSEAKY